MIQTGTTTLYLPVTSPGSCIVNREKRCSHDQPLHSLGYQLIGGAYLPLYQCTVCHRIVEEAEMKFA